MGLPGGFRTGAGPRPDTHDGDRKRADYFVWQEKDYKKHVLGIAEQPQEERAEDAISPEPQKPTASWTPQPFAGPSQLEVEKTLFAIQQLSEDLEAARAKALYLAQMGALLEAFAIREQAMQAEELALLLMLEN